MSDIVEAITGFAEAIGGPGLFVIAFLDASFLSFPQANDLLVILAVLKNPEWMPYYAGMATLGSVAGCLVLHDLASRGLASFVQRRVSQRRIDRVHRLIDRYGTVAVIVPSLLPPPAPFKLFVLLAGVGRLPRLKFAAAVAVGRGIRFFGQGLLAVWYGEQAIAFLKAHGRQVSFGIALLVLASVGAFAIWRWLRPRTV
jgi:membrane protein YqaA with SNARE-associated domain